MILEEQEHSDYQLRKPQDAKACSEQIQGMRTEAQKKQEQSTHIYQTSKSLKQVQELITLMKTIINTIIERQAMVKQYVLLSNQKKQKTKQLA